jgi:ubiquinone/menaquinone biosynthesis C-methylase UbiE
MREHEGRSTTETDIIIKTYDNTTFSELVEDYYGGSGFLNWGYWRKGTRSQKEACENLMEKLLSFLPDRSGLILDAACGKGATTRHLLNDFPPECVTGINISENQLRRCRENAPGCTFLLMDATRLEFPDASFDHVICVEAAFHFDTRDRFFREVFRVLKPGGHLVLSDILFRPGVEAMTPTLNAKNWVPDPGAYAERLRRVGFENVRVVDATEQCAEGFFRYRSQYIHRAYLAGRIDAMTFHARRIRGMRSRLAPSYYVLAAGAKPKETCVAPRATGRSVAVRRTEETGPDQAMDATIARLRTRHMVDRRPRPPRVLRARRRGL